MNNISEEISRLITDSIMINVYNQDREYELWEMAACGHVNGLYLVIYTNDAGNIPHFHVYNNQNPNKSTLDACLKLETPEYFKHDHHVDILNSKQVRTLIKFLKSNKSSKLTWWEYLISTWNANNSMYDIPEDMKMPDYMSLIRSL